MALSKIQNTMGSQAPSGKKNTMGSQAPGGTSAHPQELLESLRTKQKLYETLKNQGLIHLENPKNLEAEMARTIGELEELIAQLGEKK